MSVHIWDTEYETPKSTKIGDYLNQTVGVVVRGSAEKEDGTTKHVEVDVVNSDGQSDRVRVGSVRIIRQLAQLGEKGTDRAIVAVVPYGKRGVILAPPGKGNHDSLIAHVETA